LKPPNDENVVLFTLLPLLSSPLALSCNRVDVDWLASLASHAHHVHPNLNSVKRGKPFSQANRRSLKLRFRHRWKSKVQGSVYYADAGEKPWRHRKSTRHNEIAACMPTSVSAPTLPVSSTLGWVYYNSLYRECSISASSF
jgi:hypothetical protein